MGLRESLEGALETHGAQNPGETVRAEAKSMMLNIIEFSSLRVDDVMVPRVDIVAIDEAASMRELAGQVHRRQSLAPSRLSRDARRHHRHGARQGLHALDGCKGRQAPQGQGRQVGEAGETPAAGLSIAAAELAVAVKQSGLHRDVLFVPPSMPASDLLVRMQASHIHLAIVIDEYGGTDGLVSIEDLVEVIVGDISDEHDTEEGLQIKAVGEGIYMADGRVDIAALEDLVKIDLLSDDEEEEADTLAGLIFKIAGRVPARGEIIRHGSGLEFEILDSDPRRVKKLKVDVKKVRLPSDEAAEDASG